MVWLKRGLYLAAGLIVLWAFLPAKFASPFFERIQAPPHHIVMSNSEGHAVDPTGNMFCQFDSGLCNGWHLPFWLADYDELGRDGRASYDDYLTGLFTKLREHADATNNGKRKVLIFVHGGLNSQRGAVRRAAKLYDLIEKSPEHYYPIFINWDSSFFSGYYDYLFHVRQGEYYPIWHLKAWMLAPFYFLADTGRGILQIPMLWLSELSKTEPEEWLQENVSERISLPFGIGVERNYKRVGQQLKDRYTANPNGEVIAISEGKDLRKWPEQLWSSATFFLTLPTKILLAPLLAAYGDSSTQMNLRRPHILFHTNEEFTEAASGDYRDPDGALAVFLNRLEQEVRADRALTPPREWEITLVGHSLGTIILNEAIRRFGVTVREKNGTYVEHVLPFNHIVYMAAACTIRDYKDSVFPYLRKNGKAKFHHLTLHEEAEERERIDLVPYLDPLPRGSILVWLDDFMAHPETYLDRTLGNYANLMLTVRDTPNNLRRQISIKSFDAGETVPAPQKHSEFVDKFLFWSQDCWKPGDQVQPVCFNEKGHFE